MTDSRTYSPTEVTLLQEVARMSEKLQTVLNTMESQKKATQEQEDRIKNIESKINFAAGIISVVSAIFGFAMAYVLKKVAG